MLKPNRVVHAYRAFDRFLLDWKPDVVFSPMPHAWDPLVARTIRRRGAALVVSVHDPEPHMGQSTVAVSLLHKSIMRRAQAVVTYSNYSLATLQHQSHLPPIATSLPHPALVAPTAALGRRAVRDRGVRVGVMGRFEPYKGLDLLPEFWTTFKRTFPASELHVVGRGRGGDVGRNLEEHGISVEATYLSDPEWMARIASFDLLLLPYKEATQSGVLVDAATQGVPCVVTPVGALPEQASLLGCALVAPEATGLSLAQTAIALLLQPAVYERLSRGGVKSCWGPVSMRAFASGLEPVLEAASTLKSTGQGHPWFDGS